MPCQTQVQSHTQTLVLIALLQGVNEEPAGLF
jgi:hypothetical protein